MSDAVTRAKADWILARAAAGEIVGTRPRDLVAAEVLAERERQDAKWGEQNHPSVSGATALDRAEWYGMPTEAEAKNACDIAMGEGRLTWGHILVEEVAETIAAGDDVARRKELVQVAAVVLGWIECIDRRAARAAADTALVLEFETYQEGRKVGGT